MKKIISSFLLITFLIANSFMAVQLHWCGGKITNIDINCESESKCGCGSEMAPGCCLDVKVKVKLDNNDYKTSVTNSIGANSWNSLAVFYSVITEFNYKSPLLSIAFSAYHAPPILKGPVFLLYCNILV